ncbi:MAG: restriction endonuclease subunit S, partial [Lentisphaeraceae bacterium]|nr:restriction endonuclease subunit S [Lentisphaeraceae bacterium]
AQNWARISDHFDVIFTTEHSIEQLKQTILQLAVMGKLVKQDPADEPASVLLRKIRGEKERLVKEKKIKKQKPQPPISGDEKPFELPMGWEWLRMGTLCYKVADGPHFSPNYVEKEEGVPFLSGRNIKVDSIDLSSAKYVSKEDHEDFCKRVRPKRGDILYTKGGTTGIAKVNDIDTEFSVWVHVAVLQIPNDKVYDKYMALSLNSPHCYKQSQKFTHGIGNKDLGLTRMIKITMPFPPLAEQHRIVAKVDELMALCDSLKSRLSEVKQTQVHLADAVVETIVPNTATKQQEVQKEAKAMKILTALTLNAEINIDPQAVIAPLIKAEGGTSDAKKIWSKSKLALPEFYKQLKAEIEAGYLMKPEKAEIES